MKQKIELSSIREFGDIISDTFVVLRQNIKPLLTVYFVICGLFIVAGTLANIMFSNGFANDGFAFLFSFTGALIILFRLANYTALVLTTLCYLVLYKEKGNQVPGILEVWVYFKYYFFRAFSANILLLVALVISLFICVIPGIYLFPVCSLVLPVMVIENGNTEYSIKQAFKVIKENWWLTFGVLLLISIIVAAAILVMMLPAIIFYGSGEWLTGKSFNTTYIIIQAIATNIGQVLWMLNIIAVTLVYYTLTEQKSAGSLMKRIALFGKSNHGEDQSLPGEY